MTISISEYIDVRNRAEELGLTSPTNLALLPENFDSAVDRYTLLQSEATPTIRTLLRQSGVVDSRLDSRENPFIERHDKFFEWAGPTIFVGASLLSQNPNLLGVALNVISTYLTDFFKGLPGERTITLSVVKEDRDGENYTYRKYEYKGGIEGLRELEKIVRD